MGELLIILARWHRHQPVHENCLFQLVVGCWLLVLRFRVLMGHYKVIFYWPEAAN